MSRGCCRPWLWLRLACSTAVAYRSLVLGLIFGTALTLVHQGRALQGGAAPVWWQAALTYIIVYLTAAIATIGIQLSILAHNHKHGSSHQSHLAFLQGPAYQRMYSASSANAWLALSPPASATHDARGAHSHTDATALLQAAALQYAQQLQGCPIAHPAFGDDLSVFGVPPKDQPQPSPGPTPRRAPGLLDTATTVDLSGMPSSRSLAPNSSRSKNDTKHYETSAKDAESDTTLMLSARSGASDGLHVNTARSKKRSSAGNSHSEAVSLLDQPQMPTNQTSPFSVLASSQSPFRMAAPVAPASQPPNTTAPHSTTSALNPPMRLTSGSSLIARSGSLSSITSILHAESIERPPNLSTTSSLGLLPGDLTSRPTLADTVALHSSLTSRNTNPSTPRSPSSFQPGALSRPGSAHTWSSPQRGLLVPTATLQPSFTSSSSMTYQPSPLASRLAVDPAYPEASQQNPDRLMQQNPLAMSGEFSSFTRLSLGASQILMLEGSMDSRSDQSISLSGTGNVVASANSVVSGTSTHVAHVRGQKASVSAVPGMDAYSNWMYQQHLGAAPASRLSRTQVDDQGGEGTDLEAGNKGA